MRPLKERISITIDSDLVEELRIKAKEDWRPLAQYINWVLRKYMDEGSQQTQGKTRNRYTFDQGDLPVKVKKERLSITLDNDLLEELRKKADEDCRPLSQYISLILRKYIEQEGKE